MLIYDSGVREWVSVQLFGCKDGFNETDTAIGVLRESKLIAGVVYNNYVKNVSIEMSIASIDKRWALRHNIRAFFKYPFTQLDLRRVTALCSKKEGDTMDFLKRLGFTQEGIHRQAHYDGSDAVSFGMLKPECRWLHE